MSTIISDVEYLSPQEFAAIVGASIPTIYRAVDSGRVASIGIMGRIAIPRSEVDRYIPDRRGGYRGGGRPRKQATQSTMPP